MRVGRGKDLPDRWSSARIWRSSPSSNSSARGRGSYLQIRAVGAVLHGASRSLRGSAVPAALDVPLPLSRGYVCFLISLSAGLHAAAVARRLFMIAW